MGDVLLRLRCTDGHGSEQDHVIPYSSTGSETLFVCSGNNLYFSATEENVPQADIVARIFAYQIGLNVQLKPYAEVTVRVPVPDELAEQHPDEHITIYASSSDRGNYIYLRPYDTVDFFDGYSITILFDHLDSAALAQMDRTADDASRVSSGDNVDTGILVKSSNPEPIANASDDDATDSETDEPGSEHSSARSSNKTPSNVEKTPGATIRRPEPDLTIKETPNAKDVEDDEGPFSTARDVPSEELGEADSPTIRIKRNLASDEIPSTLGPKLIPASAHANAPSAEELGELFPSAKPPETTYGGSKKRGSARVTPDVATGNPEEPDNGEQTTVLNGVGSIEQYAEGARLDDGEHIDQQAVYDNATSELDSHSVFLKAASRTTASKRSVAARQLEEEDEDDATPAIKKPKTSVSPVASFAAKEEVDDDGDEGADVEDADNGDDDLELEALAPGRKEKEGSENISFSAALQTQETASEIIVVQRKAVPRSSARTQSPEVVIKVHRDSTTPGSNAASVASGKAPKILLSNSGITEKLALAKWLNEQGVVVIDKLPTRRTNFVCVVSEGPLKTTAKILRSLALGKLVITDKFVKESKAAGRLLDPDDFVHCELAPSIRIDRRNLFGEKHLYFTSTLVKQYGKSGWDDIVALTKEAGASHSETGSAAVIGKAKGRNNVIMFGSDKNDQDVGALINDYGCTVHRKDLLTHSIISGELDLTNEEFVLSAGRPVKKSKR